MLELLTVLPVTLLAELALLPELQLSVLLVLVRSESVLLPLLKLSMTLTELSEEEDPLVLVLAVLPVSLMERVLLLLSELLLLLEELDDDDVSLDRSLASVSCVESDDVLEVELVIAASELLLLVSENGTSSNNRS